MEISKMADSTELATLSVSDIQKIEKYHKSITETQTSPFNRPPSNAPLHLVLSPNSSSNAENVASLVVFFASLGGVFAGLAVGVAMLGHGWWGLVSGVFLVAAYSNGIRMESGRVSLLGLMQRGWVKLGLPARNFHIARKKGIETRLAYEKGMALHSKRLSKMKKEISPLLEKINNQGGSHTFTFGDTGLVASPRAVPESIAKLNQEVGRIAAMKAGL